MKVNYVLDTYWLDKNRNVLRVFKLCSRVKNVCSCSRKCVFIGSVRRVCRTLFCHCLLSLSKWQDIDLQLSERQQLYFAVSATDAIGPHKICLMHISHKTGKHFPDLASAKLIGWLYATSETKGTQGFFKSVSLLGL